MGTILAGLGTIRCRVYQSCVKEYSEGWYEDYLRDAGDLLAVDEEGRGLPFVVMLGLLPGKIEEDMNSGSEMFDRVVKQCGWCMSVVVFESIDAMRDFAGIMECKMYFEGREYVQDRGLEKSEKKG